MIYLLYGEDTYRSWQKLQQIKRKYIDGAMGDTDLVTLYGASLDPHEFRRQVQTLPFLAKSRLVIIRDLLREGRKEVAESILADLSHIASTSVVFFHESGKPDKRSKLFQTLNKPKVAQEFNLLEANQLIGYAVKAAAELGLVLAPALAQKITALTGPDLWRLHQELDKIQLYIGQGRVTNEVIDQLLSGSPEARIFDLTDAFGQRRSQQAIKLIDQLANSENDLGLLAMIAGHYRNLILVADSVHGRAEHQSQPQNQSHTQPQRQQLPKQLHKAELAKLLDLHPFVLDKALQQANNYSLSELRSIYRYLFELDLSVKQSLLEATQGLKFLAKILEERPLRLPRLTEENML